MQGAGNTRWCGPLAGPGGFLFERNQQIYMNREERLAVLRLWAKEHRCRIVKDVLRNTAEEVSDSAMEAACGLHNLRVGKS